MKLKMIKLTDIVANPLQPRQDFNQEKLQELANSIKEGDLLQPIVVRLNGNNTYEIVAGERRYKAFQILKEPKIPCIIRNITDDTDALEKSLIENLQRDDLTSIERENAISDLWKSDRYKTHVELARKLGMSRQHIGRILEAKEFREKNKVSSVSTFSIVDTKGLFNEPRKKLLKQVGENKIPVSYIHDIVYKVKEFPEPEQQIAILEEFEQQEDMSREIFDDIIRKKKEIAEGERNPEHIIKIETDSDLRLLDDYSNIKRKVFEIYSSHIQHLKHEENKKEAIEIIKEIVSYLNKQLEALEENVVVELDEKKKENSN